MMDYYYQCRFEQLTPDGIDAFNGWIKGDKSKVGDKIPLVCAAGLWTIVSKDSVGIDRQEYLKRVAKARDKFASIQGGVA